MLVTLGGLLLVADNGLLANDLACCCQSGSGSGSGSGGEECTGCDSIPANLVCEIRNATNCGCANSDVDLTYNGATGKWEGSGAFCGHSIDLAMRCEDVGFGVTDVFLAIAFHDGCTIDQEPGGSWSCPRPFEVIFLPGDMPTCCGTSSPAFPKFTVRE